jgi:hypothetical protein
MISVSIVFATPLMLAACGIGRLSIFDKTRCFYKGIARWAL